MVMFTLMFVVVDIIYSLQSKKLFPAKISMNKLDKYPEYNQVVKDIMNGNCKS